MTCSNQHIAAIAFLATIITVLAPTQAPEDDRLPVAVQIRKDCPSDCKCSLDHGANVIVDCTNSSWSRVPPKMPDNIDSLTLSLNVLRKLDRMSFANRNLSNLQHLDLTNVNLTSLASDTFEDMPKLKKLNVDDNDLSTNEVLELLSKMGRRRFVISVQENPRVDCRAVQRLSRNAICDLGDAESTSTTQVSTSVPTTTKRDTSSPILDSTTSTVHTPVTTAHEGDGDDDVKGSEIGVAGWIGIAIAFVFVCLVVVSFGVVKYRRRRKTQEEQEEGNTLEAGYDSLEEAMDFAERRTH